ncbi:hypothetical protein ACSBR2_022651 [Camellia fascicularis]
MRYLGNVPRRCKSSFREGDTSHPLIFFNRVNFIFICMVWLIFVFIFKLLINFIYFVLKVSNFR